MNENDALFTPRRTLVLKRGKERMVANRHPWIFAGAIQTEKGPEDAPIADLVESDGTRVASGFYSRSSQIRLRALTFRDEELSAATLAARIGAAVKRRSAIFDETTNAARIVHAEGDELSSVVVDRYNDVLVVEISNHGADQLRAVILEELQRLLAPRMIYCKNDLPVRALERLSTEDVWVGEGDTSTSILESGLRFDVDPAEGQKTGFFLDQRENRRLTRALAGGRSVLNLFSYSGAFGVYAAAGGASSVTNVDVSAPAIEAARGNHRLNGFEAEFIVADAFQYVRQRHEAVDFIVCDPPAFARNRGDVDRAARGYKDVNLFALKMVKPGGLMMTFSCSGHMSLDLFQKVIFSAALDAGRRVSFVKRLGAGPDHPVSLYCPEGEYLKGFLLEVH